MTAVFAISRSGYRRIVLAGYVLLAGWILFSWPWPPMPRLRLYGSGPSGASPGRKQRVQNALETLLTRSTTIGVSVVRRTQAQLAQLQPERGYLALERGWPPPG